MQSLLMLGNILDLLPLWGIFLFTILMVLLSVETGYWLGKYRHKRSELEKEQPVSGMVGATLGLLAFLLAFTFGLAANRFDARREVVLDESNAIGTAYLRTSMLPANGEEIRKLLRQYVDVRLDAVRTKQVEAAIRTSEEIHDKLWATTTLLAKDHPNSIVVGLFIQSLNEVIDVHAKRVQVNVRGRIPGTIWMSLYAVAVLSLGTMGYHGGLAGTSRSLAVLAVALSFSGVLLVVADLDRPLEGTLMVSQQTMIDLQKSMAKP